MAISCICHYPTDHKLVTAHLECRASIRFFAHVNFFNFLIFIFELSIAIACRKDHRRCPPGFSKLFNCTPAARELNIIIESFPEVTDDDHVGSELNLRNWILESKFLKFLTWNFENFISKIKYNRWNFVNSIFKMEDLKSNY